jgi:hypothetical protein
MISAHETKCLTQAERFSSKMSSIAGVVADQELQWILKLFL